MMDVDEIVEGPRMVGLGKVGTTGCGCAAEVCVSETERSFLCRKHLAELVELIGTAVEELAVQDENQRWVEAKAVASVQTAVGCVREWCLMDLRKDWLHSVGLVRDALKEMIELVRKECGDPVQCGVW